MRLAARKDANHNEILDALRAEGYSVLDLWRLGRDAPDCLVGNGKTNTLLEIKTTSGKLSDGQRKFLDNWKGPRAVVRSVVEALEAVRIIEANENYQP